MNYKRLLFFFIFFLGFVGLLVSPSKVLAVCYDQFGNPEDCNAPCQACDDWGIGCYNTDGDQGWCSNCKTCSGGICVNKGVGAGCSGCSGGCGGPNYSGCDVRAGSCSYTRCECDGGGSCRNYCSPSCGSSCGPSCSVTCPDCDNIANCGVCAAPPTPTPTLPPGVTPPPTPTPGGPTSTPAPTPTPGGGNYRVVGRVTKDDVVKCYSVYNGKIASSDGKTASECGNCDPDPACASDKAAYEIGRWAAGTNLVINMDTSGWAPGYTCRWDFDADAFNPGGESSGSDCSAEITLGSGNQDWQNHLWFHVSRPTPTPTPALGTIRGKVYLETNGLCTSNQEVSQADKGTVTARPSGEIEVPTYNCPISGTEYVCSNLPYDLVAGTTYIISYTSPSDWVLSGCCSDIGSVTLGGGF